MKTRKKKLILIQLTIFFVASLLLYNTYKDEPVVEEQVVEIQTQSDPDRFEFGSQLPVLLRLVHLYRYYKEAMMLRKK